MKQKRRRELKRLDWTDGREGEWKMEKKHYLVVTGLTRFKGAGAALQSNPVPFPFPLPPFHPSKVGFHSIFYGVWDITEQRWP